MYFILNSNAFLQTTYNISSAQLRAKKREEDHSTFRKLLLCSKGEESNAADIVNMIANDQDLEEQIISAKMLREITSKPCHQLPVYVEQGLIEVVTEHLIESKNMEKKVEGIGIIANISAEFAEEIIKSKVYVHLFELMMIPELNEGCLRTLINLLKNGSDVRDLLLQHGILYRIISLSVEEHHLKIHQLLASAMLQITQFPVPSEAFVVQLVPMIQKYLEFDDFDVIHNCLWAIHNLLDEKNITVIAESNIAPYLVKVLGSPYIKCAQIALNIMRQITLPMDESSINDVLCLIPVTFNNNGFKRMKEILTFMTTIAESKDHQCWRFILEDIRLLEMIMDVLRCGNVSVIEEAMKLISQLAIRGDYEDVKRLVNKTVIESMCELLGQDQKPDVLKICLETLMIILSKSQRYLGYIVFVIDDCGGVDNLEKLMIHYNQEIGDLAIEILAQYFTDDIYQPLPSELSYLSELSICDEENLV